MAPLTPNNPTNIVHCIVKLRIILQRDFLHGQNNMGSFSSSLCVLLLLAHCGNYLSGATSALAYDDCLAWRLNVEINNFRNWTVVPPGCISRVAGYLTSGQYELDFSVAIGQAQAYVKTLDLTGDGKDAWVYDVDETALSNLPYYANHRYGGEPHNSTAFNKWVSEAKAPALVAALDFYNQLISAGFKVFFVSERDNATQRNVTEKNLLDVGYEGWADLILRNGSDQGKPAPVYKSEKREIPVNEGYRIWGNIGDQWGDLTGNFAGNRTFKLPNPMYTYVSVSHPGVLRLNGDVKGFRSS